MNASTTRWLLLLALGLGAFIVVYERRTPGTETATRRADLVFPDLETNDVTAIEVMRGTNFFLRVVRTNDQWRYVAPFADAAQSDAVARLLAGLAGLPARSRLTPAEVLAVSNGPAAFGLSPPAAVVAVQRGAGRDQLELGSATLLGDQVFAQVVGRQGLCAVPRDFSAVLPADVNDWRETALVQLADRRFDRFEVRPATNGFEILLDPTNLTWRLSKPLATLADNARIKFLLQRLELAQVGRFVADDPRADLEPFGLQSPEREVVIGRGTNELLTLQVGHSPTNDPALVYVRRLPASNVVLVARAAIDPWLARFPDFCDRRLMIFRLEDVARIEARVDEAFALQRVGTNDWQIEAPFKAPADRVLVLEMLAEMAGLQFSAFEREVVADFAPYGLDPPRRQYTLRAASTNAPGGTNGLVVAQLSLGNAKDTRFFARRMQESSVVTFLDPERLPRGAFQLRDRRIWNFTTNDVVGITIHQLGETRKLQRSPAGQWSVVSGAATNVNSFTLEEATWRLGQLRAERWVGRGEPELSRYGFGTVDHRITLELRLGGQTATRVVRFGRRSASGRVYAAVELGDQPGPVIFECPAPVFEYVQSDLTLLPPGP